MAYLCIECGAYAVKKKVSQSPQQIYGPNKVPKLTTKCSACEEIKDCTSYPLISSLGIGVIRARYDLKPAE